MLRKFSCFARCSEAKTNGNTEAGFIQNPLADFDQRKFEFRLKDTALENPSGSNPRPPAIVHEQRQEPLFVLYLWVFWLVLTLGISFLMQDSHFR